MLDGGAWKLGFPFLGLEQFAENFVRQILVVGVGEFKQFHKHGILLLKQTYENEIRGEEVLMQVDHLDRTDVQGFDRFVG